MTPQEKIKQIKNVRYYIEHYLWIRDKKGKTVKLKLKPAQERLYEIVKQLHDEGKPVRIVILKARQLGLSTLIEAMFFAITATSHNKKTLIVAHDTVATSNLFNMNKFFFDHLPDPIKPMTKASNAREILFENPTRDPVAKQKNPGFRSSIKCVPANGEVGRSDTLTNVHASEVAFWRTMNQTLDSLSQAVPNEPNTSIIIETTPNGFNQFKEFWDDTVAGKTDYIPVFLPWFEDPDYRKPVPPGTVWTEEELLLKKTYDLDDEQLSWRRQEIRSNLRGDSEKFKQEYPSCPEEAFLMSGNPFFENAIVIARLNEKKLEPIRGRYVYEEAEDLKPLNWEFVEAEDGEILIWRKPEELFPYVLGGDTAGDGSDRFTAHVLDNTTGKQAAQILYEGSGELYYTQQVYCLGMDYGKALAGIEINYSTYPEKKLEEWGYPNLYIREKVDDSRGTLDVYKWGWRTDLRTRPLILANLQTAVATVPDMFESVDLLREMLSFIRNENMRPEAAAGMHDDLVMAAAIAHHIRDQQSYTSREVPEERKKKLIDKLDPKHRYRRKR